MRVPLKKNRRDDRCDYIGCAELPLITMRVFYHDGYARERGFCPRHAEKMRVFYTDMIKN